MAVFPRTNPVRLAPGSFQQPIALPSAAPNAADLLTVCFNKDWLPILLGCLLQLTLSTTWQADNDDELEAALSAANAMILLFQKALPGCQSQNPGFVGASEDYMLRQNPDNPCELQSSVDGVTWCTWADISKCTPAAQPGNGTIQPASGQCKQFHGSITPTGAWVLPVPVNAGDQVTVSNLIGAWSPTAFTEIWDCPDGNLFFGGICIDGTAAFDSGAPMPSAPLNGTIMYDGTNFYDVSSAANVGTPAVVTIMPGVSNAQLIVRSNFHGGVEPAGEVNFDIEVCNNTPATWSHVINLALSTAGWSPASINPCVGGSNGTYIPTQGWHSAECEESASEWVQRVEVHLPFSVDINFLSYSATFDEVVGTNGRGDTLQTFIGYEDAGGTFHSLEVIAAATATNQVIAHNASFTARKLVFICLCDSEFASPTNGSALFKSFSVAGTGTDPFV